MADKNQVDQEKLAEEWAKALAEEGVMDESENKEETKSETKGEEIDQDKLAEEWAKALAEEEEGTLKQEKEKKKKSFEAQEVKFKDISGEVSEPTGEKRDIEFILDIPLNVSAELGRSKLLINDLLQLGQGSVIELDKLAGEPLEILVNGKLVARGEAVVINEKYGVRLTDIISPMERVKQLG
ncbi:flagellar motor switch protein FliN [Desulfothermus sp.]